MYRKWKAKRAGWHLGQGFGLFHGNFKSRMGNPEGLRSNANGR